VTRPPLEEGHLRLGLHGENISLGTIGEAMTALENLLRELSRAAGDEGVQWQVVSLRFICDGCGRDRPEEHDDWHYADGDDFCPECWAGTTEEPKA
jgi:hypothetical protein